MATAGGHRTAHHQLAGVHQLHRVARGLVHLPAGLVHQLGRTGPLESPWVATDFGALLLASIALVVWRRRRRPAGPPGWSPWPRSAGWPG